MVARLAEIHCNQNFWDVLSMFWEHWMLFFMFSKSNCTTISTNVKETSKSSNWTRKKSWALNEIQNIKTPIRGWWRGDLGHDDVFFGCVANKNSLSQIWTYPIIYKQKRSKKNKKERVKVQKLDRVVCDMHRCCLKYVVWCMCTVSWFSTMGFMFFIRSKIEMCETFTFYIPKISSFMVQTVQTMEIPQIQRGQPRSFMEFFNVRHWLKIQRHPPFPKIPAKCFF